HGIGEIALPANPPPAQLFELLQALADQPGAHDVASRLAAAGANRIRIAPAGPAASSSPPAPRGPVASSEVFGAREPVLPNPDTPLRPPRSRGPPRPPPRRRLPAPVWRCRPEPRGCSPSSSATARRRTWATFWRR